MYEVSYGSKYKESQENSYKSAADIAKLMRADIKAAIGKGELPGAMANYSVKVHNYSGGRSINVEAQGLDGMWQLCSGYGAGCNYYGHERSDFEGHDVLSEEGKRVEGILKEIHWSYNYDGSESQVDYFNVNYYGSASIEDERSAKWRAGEKARKAARKAAKEAA